MLLSLAHEGTAEFDALVARLERRGEADLERVEGAVREVLKDVRAEGDAAVRRFVERFENRRVEQLVQTDYGGREALESLPRDVRDALLEGARRVRRYHERQLEDLVSFEYEEDGVLLGSRVRPLARVG
ncbi:MAG: histidinol dehydrogenase, partial [Thermoanaerobaculia bacterium]